MQGLEGYCHVRGHVEGHFAVSTQGDPQYKAVVEECLANAIGDVIVQFDKAKFEAILKGKSIPDEEIKGYLAKLFIDDETYFVRKEYKNL